MHRLNTYPVTHTGFLHALLNALALTPLLARFELESGTLLAAALLAGRTCRPLPAPRRARPRHRHTSLGPLALLLLEP